MRPGAVEMRGAVCVIGLVFLLVAYTTAVYAFQVARGLQPDSAQGQALLRLGLPGLSGGQLATGLPVQSTLLSGRTASYSNDHDVGVAEDDAEEPPAIVASSPPRLTLITEGPTWTVRLSEARSPSASISDLTGPIVPTLALGAVILLYGAIRTRWSR